MKLSEKLLVSLIAILLLLLLLGAGELFCRFFARINTFEISRDLYVPRRFGSSLGHVSNGNAVAFGVLCHTDENGFRVDPTFKDTECDKAILFLGDSVGFGVGVPEDQTAIGLLRRSLPGVRFYNSSVIGYWAGDYKNVVDFFIPEHPQIKTVYAIMCLNDIVDESATDIRDVFSLGIPQQMPDNIATRAMKFGFLHDVNAWLRSRSKLYILLKSMVEDTSMRAFWYDLQQYQNSKTDFEIAMSAFNQINEQLGKAGIRFKVIIIPYEVQLRSYNEAFMLPQKMIRESFVEQGIDFIDATEFFRNSGYAPQELYLYNDPMHLSAAGHRVLNDILVKDIATIKPGKQPN
jgi:hypothetical protein